MSAQNTYLHHLIALFVVYTQVHHHEQVGKTEIEKAIRSLVEEFDHAQANQLVPAWETTTGITKFPSIVKQFFQDYRVSQAGVALHKYLLALQTAGRLPATVKNYRSDIGQFLNFAPAKSPDQLVQKTEVARFLEFEQQRGSSQATIHRKVASLSQFFQWLQENGWLTTNLWKSFSSTSFSELLKTDKPVRELTTMSSLTDERPAVWSLPLKTIDLQAYLPQHFQNALVRAVKKTSILTRMRKAISAQPLLGYFNLAMGIIFFLGAGFLGYQQFFSDADSSLAFPTSLTRPNRSLSFQGRLTNTSRTPITAITPMRFRLYDSGPAIGSGTLLWDSTSCNIDPDQDGIFSTTLGDACGTEITADVFTENSNVWLEVEVNSEILEPRQSIKTVAYALNSETLQGYPASASAVENTVLVMRNDGKVVFGNANPILEATGDSFTLTANVLTLETSSGSNGNVIINPDGTGQTLINSNTIIDGYLHAPGATLSATYAGGTALTLKAGPTATGDIMQWQSSAGSPLGVIDENGNIGIGTTAPGQKLDVAGDAEIANYLYFANGATDYLRFDGSNFILSNDFLPSADSTYDLGASGTAWAEIYGDAIYQNGNAVCDASGNCGSASLWSSNLGALYPNNSTFDVLIGGTASSSAKFAFLNVNSGIPTASIAGNLALAAPTGADPATKLNVYNGGSFGIRTSVGGDAALTERLTILNNGNVGIGSATPSQQLEVGGNVEIANYLYFANGATNYLRFDGSDFILSNDFLPSANNTYNLGASGTRWANIYGTNLYQNGNQVCDTSGNCSAAGSDWTIANGTIYPKNSTTDLLVGGISTASAKFAFMNVNSGTPTASISGTTGATFLTANGYLSTTNRQSLTLGNSAAYNTTGNILLNPNGTGNVGIGTTSPSSPLQLHGPSTGLVDILKISKAGGSTSYMSVFSNTSNTSNFDPSFLGFHGSGGSSALQFIGGMDAGNDTGGNSPLVSFQARRGGVSGSAVVSRDLFDFNNYGTSVMRINVSGYVGIGTTSPTAKLDIAGSASTSGTLSFRGTTDPTIDILNGENFGFRTSVGGDASLTERLTILNNGNVGIGTTNPSFFKLEVAGDIGPTTSNLYNLGSGSISRMITMDQDLSTADASFIGEDASDYSGVSVSNVGDVNGDGYDDFAIGAYYDDDGGANAGQTYLILGQASGWAMDTDLSAADASFIGEDAGDRSGSPVSGVGDVNGDGYDDFVIVAQGDGDGGANAGQTYLILGQASGWSMDTDLSAADASFIGEDTDDYSGTSVSGTGDVNGDGYDDFIIGAYADEDGGATAGQTYLILGQASGWAMDTDLSAVDASFIGEDNDDYSGTSVSGTGDVNGDGYDDFIIGAYADEDGGSFAGQTYLILGQDSGWAMDTDLSVADASFWGEDSNDFSGESASGVGDVNGDGYDDFVIGARGDEEGGGANAGQTYLILGQNSGWAMDTDLSVADASFIGEDASDYSGTSVSGTGDVNGDGYDDFIIGAYADEDGGATAGQTYLILGQASGWAMDTDLSAVDASFWGEDANDRSGESVSGAGDVNGDGFDDFIIAARGDGDGGAAAGQTYLILSDERQWDKVFARNFKAGDSLNVGAHLRFYDDTIESLSPLYIDTTRLNLLGGLTTTGNVGIGTTAPSQKLDVVGAIRLGAADAENVLHTTVAGGAPSGNLYWGDRTVCDSSGSCGGSGTWTIGSGIMYPINNTVDVLIGGVSSASAKFAFLNVNSGIPTASIAGNLALATPTGADPATKLNVYNGGSFGIRTSVGGDASLTERLTILNNGNVGIGTTSPSEKLSLAGGNFLHSAVGNPTLEATIDTSGTAYDVFVAGKFAYVADGASGLHIIDVSDPATPALLGTYNTGGEARGIHVIGKYAYVADGAAGLVIVDVSNPYAPALVDTYNTSGTAYAVYVSGRYAYVADRAEGLQIIDISNPYSVDVVGAYDTLDYTNEVFISGKYAYLADDDQSLVIVDISDPLTPAYVSTIGAGVYGADDVYVSGRYAYVAVNSSLKIVDITDPTTPSYKDTGGSMGESVHIAGNYAYTTGGTNGFEVLDINDPTSIVSIGTFDTSGTANEVYVSGKYAYIADGTSGLQIIDINGIETPSLYAGTINTNSVNISEDLLVGQSLSVRNGINISGGAMIEGATSVWSYDVDTTGSTHNIFTVGADSTPYLSINKTEETAEVFLGQWNTDDGTFLSIDDYTKTVDIVSTGLVTLGDKNGEANSTLFTIDNPNQNFLFANGNVGIGSTAPSQVLDVVGGIRLGAADAENVLHTTVAGGAPSGNLYWGNRTVCDSSGSCGGSGTWTIGSGIMYPINNTVDVLIGGVSSTSAKFAFLNVNGGSPTASIAGNLSLVVPTGSTPATKLNILNGGTLSIQNSVGGDAGLSTSFSVSPAQITSVLPHQFTAAGDVSIAYDLIFTNQTSSNIQTNGPFTITAGESWENNNLTLSTYGSGNLLANLGDTGKFQITSADPSVILDTITATDTDFWLGVQEDAGGDDDDIFSIGDGTTIGTNSFFSINTAGNVGIGTTAPTYKLQVAGDIKLSDGTNRLILASNTTNPTGVAGAMFYDSDDNKFKCYTTSWVDCDTVGAGSLPSGTEGQMMYNDAGSWTAFSGMSWDDTNNYLDIVGSASSSGTLAFRGTTDPKINILNGEAFGIQTSVGGDVGLTERLTILNNGNVGIGSTAPSSSLEVAGSVELANYLYFGNSTSEYLRWDGSDFLVSDDFLPNANDTLNLGATGARWADLYLGPETLHIGSTTTDEGTISYDTTGDIFNFGTDATTNGDIAFFTDDLYLDKATGNVGIGTTVPSQALDVTGAIRLGAADAENVLHTTVAGGAPSGALYWGDRTVCDSTGNCSTVDSNWSIAGGSIYPKNTTLDMFIGGTATSSAKFAFSNTNSGTPTASIAGSLALAAPTGADPATKLNVYNGGSFGIRTSVGGDASLTERLTILNNGNVGIGTTSPGQKLHIASASDLLVELDVGATGRAAQWYLYRGTNKESWLGMAGSNNFDFWTKEHVPVRFGSNNLERVRIDTSGNVGIGTTSPGAKLDVEGDRNLSGQLYVHSGVPQSDGALLLGSTIGIGANIYAHTKADGTISSAASAPGLRFTSSGLDILTSDETSGTRVWDQRMRIDIAGNVGIGTTVPSSRLDISDLATTDHTILSITGEIGQYFYVGNYHNSALVAFGDYDENLNGTYVAVEDSTKDIYIHSSGVITIGDGTGSGNGTLFTTNDSNQAFLFENGNVGIGSTAPSQVLDVVGGIRLGAADAENVLHTTVAGGAPSGNLYWGNRTLCDSTGSCGGGSSNWTLGAGFIHPINPSVDLFIGGTASSSAKFAFLNVNSGTPTASIAGSLALAAPTGADPATKLNVYNGGSFGIRTSVGGDVGLTERLTVLNNGNVGIGSTAPANSLDVTGDIGLRSGKILKLYTSGDSNYNVIYSTTANLYMNSGNGEVITQAVSNIDFQTWTGGSYNSKMVVTNVGNVGIGTTNPLRLLDVRGSATISGTLQLAPNVQVDAGTCDASAKGKQYFDGSANLQYVCNGTAWTQMNVAFTSSDGAGVSNSGSGLEFGTNGFGLIQGCADTEVLKWNEGSSIWECKPSTYSKFVSTTNTNIVNSTGNTSSVGTTNVDVDAVIGAASSATQVLVQLGVTATNTTAANWSGHVMPTGLAADTSNGVVWTGELDGAGVGYGMAIVALDANKVFSWGLTEIAGTSTGTLAINVVGYWTPVTTGADLAENYYGSSSIESGDLVSLDPSLAGGVIKSQGENPTSIIGVVSSQPGMVLDEVNDPNQAMTVVDNKYLGRVPIAVGLVGRVPVKVTTENGPINAGDPITISSFPGIGMKATQPGIIVGRALENYSNSDPMAVGLVMVFLNLDQYEPLIALDDFGNLIIANDENNDYQIVNQATPLATPFADRFGAFTKTLTAILEAGLIKTKELVVSGQAQIADLSVTNFSINGQTLRDYVVSIIQENQATNPVIAEISPTPAPTSAASGSAWLAEVFHQDQATGQPIVENLDVSDTLSVKAIEGASITAQSLEVSDQTKLGSLLVNQDASVAGVFTTNELDANSARIDALEAGMAQLDSVRATTAEFANATISGTLYAQTIADLDKQIAELLDQPSIIDVISGNIPSPQNDFSSLYQVLGSISSTASQAGQLNQTVADLNLADDDIVLDASAGFIDRYFKVNGVAYVGDSLGVGNTLRVGQKLELTDTYLSFSTEANTPDESPIFFIQPSGKGLLALMGGLMTLDETGQVTINGNLHVAGDVSVEGTLLANVIEPLNQGDSLKLNLGPTNTGLEATMAGNLASPSGQLEFLGDAGTPVATVSAQGKASFSSLSLGRDLLARPSVAGAATESSQLTQEATQTTGRATLPAGNRDLIIRNPNVRRDSLIYLTPLNSTNNQVLYVNHIEAPVDESTAQASDERSFTVSLDNVTASDISFTWWIVN